MDNVPYSRARFKGSHNSYESEHQPLTLHLEFHPDRPWHGGCRGLEFDLFQKKDDFQWSVAHTGGYKPDPERQFRRHLRWLRGWSDMNPGHDVVTVTLDLKNAPGDHDDFARELDAYIDEHLGASHLYTPDDLRCGEADLVTGAELHGWPELGELRGKLILCLSGSSHRKRAYARSGSVRSGDAVGGADRARRGAEPRHVPGAGRLCFADKKYAGGYFPNQRRGKRKRRLNRTRHRVFLNSEVGTWTHWVEDMRVLAGMHAFVTRGYTIGGFHWRHAVRARINILATDAVFGKKWAKVGSLPFSRW